MAKKRLFALSFIGVFICTFLNGFSSPPSIPTTIDATVIENKDNISNVRHGIDAALFASYFIESQYDRMKQFESIASHYIENNEYASAIAVAESAKGTNATVAKMNIYSLVCIAYAKSGNTAEAVNLTKNITNISVRHYVIEQLIIYLLSEDMQPATAALFESISNPTLYARMQGELVRYYAKKKNMQEAKKILASIDTDTEKNSALQELIMESLKTSQKLDTGLLDQITSSFTQEKTYQKIAVHFTKNNNVDSALEWAYKITSNDLFDSTLLQMVVILADQSKFESAYQMIDKVYNEKNKMQAFSTLCVSLAKKKQEENAFTIAEFITSDDVRLSTYTELAMVFASHSLIDASLSAVNKIQDTYISQKILIDVIEVLGTQTDYHYPLFIINQIDSEPLRFKALTAFVSSFSSIGSYDQCKKFIEPVSDPNLRNIANASMAKHFANRKMIDASKECVSLIDDQSLKCDTYFRLSEIAFSQSRRDDSVYYMKLLSETVSRISDPDIQLTAYVHLAILQGLNNHNTAMVKSSKNAFEIMSSSPLSISDKEKIRLLINQLFLKGLYKESFELIDSISDINLRIDMLQRAPVLSTKKEQKLIREYATRSLSKIVKQ